MAAVFPGLHGIDSLMHSYMAICNVEVLAMAETTEKQKNCCC